MSASRTILGLLTTATLLAAVGAPAAATATSEPDPDTPIAVDLIEGLTWTLQRQTLDGVVTEVPAGVTVTLLLDGGTASGDGGCNRYFASYERDGEALSFSGIGSTEMYCPHASDTEASYLANLAAVATAFSTGGSLVMTDAAGDALLEYTPAETEPIPTDGLESLSWQLDWLVLPGSSEPVAVPAGLSAGIVLEGGTASGHGGCNSWSASYELDGAALRFGPVASTKMACPDPIMDLEQAFFELLASVASWSSDGASLTLLDAEGSELARLGQAAAG